MASGRPDYHPTMLLEGKHGTELIPVLVDANGQMYIVMTGSGGLTVNLDALGNIIARIKGFDGVDLRDVKVDAAGNMIARMKGFDGLDLQDVKVDDAGYMLAKMLGLYNATLKMIAVDADGVMRANLTAQDLNYLKFRPVYGQCQAFAQVGYSVESGVTYKIINLAGRGAILSGVLGWTPSSAQSGMTLRLDVDGVTVHNLGFETLSSRSNFQRDVYPIFTMVYDDVLFKYQVGFSAHTPFESDFEFYVTNPYGAAVTFWCYIFYALVP